MCVCKSLTEGEIAILNVVADGLHGQRRSEGMCRSREIRIPVKRKRGVCMRSVCSLRSVDTVKSKSVKDAHTSPRRKCRPSARSIADSAFHVIWRSCGIVENSTGRLSAIDRSLAQTYATHILVLDLCNHKKVLVMLASDFTERVSTLETGPGCAVEM